MQHQNAHSHTRQSQIESLTFQNFSSNLLSQALNLYDEHTYYTNVFKDMAFIIQTENSTEIDLLKQKFNSIVFQSKENGFDLFNWISNTSWFDIDNFKANFLALNGVFDAESYTKSDGIEFKKFISSITKYIEDQVNAIVGTFDQRINNIFNTAKNQLYSLSNLYGWDSTNPTTEIQNEVSKYREMIKNEIINNSTIFNNSYPEYKDYLNYSIPQSVFDSYATEFRKYLQKKCAELITWEVNHFSLRVGAKSRDYYKILYQKGINGSVSINDLALVLDGDQNVFKNHYDAGNPTNGGSIYKSCDVEYTFNSQASTSLVTVEFIFTIDSVDYKFTWTKQIPIFSYFVNDGVKDLEQRFLVKPDISNEVVNSDAIGELIIPSNLIYSSSVVAVNDQSKWQTINDFKVLLTKKQEENFNKLINYWKIVYPHGTIEKIYFFRENGLDKIAFILNDSSIHNADFDFGDNISRNVSDNLIRTELSPFENMNRRTIIIPSKFITKLEKIKNEFDQMISSTKIPVADFDEFYNSLQPTLTQDIFKKYFPDYETKILPLLHQFGFNDIFAIETHTSNPDNSRTVIIKVTFNDGSGNSIVTRAQIKLINADELLKSLFDDIQKNGIVENSFEDGSLSVDIPKSISETFTGPIKTEDLKSIISSSKFNDFIAMGGEVKGNLSMISLSPSNLYSFSLKAEEIMENFNKNSLVELKLTDLLVNFQNIIKNQFIPQIPYGIDDQSNYLIVNAGDFNHYNMAEFKIGTHSKFSTTIIAHFLSQQQRVLQGMVIQLLIDKYFNKIVSQKLLNNNLDEQTKQRVYADFNKLKNQIIVSSFTILGLNTTLFPDRQINVGGSIIMVPNIIGATNLIQDSKLKDVIESIKSSLKQFDFDFDTNYKVNLQTLSKISKAFKYTLVSIGSLLGASSLLAWITSYKTMKSSKLDIKFKGKTKKRKGLVITSALAGIGAATISTLVMIYVFIMQGGF